MTGMTCIVCLVGVHQPPAMERAAAAVERICACHPRNLLRKTDVIYVDL